MTITMTAKHQITIPKKITDALGLKKGCMFKVAVTKDKIELVPLETKERAFTEKEYERLEALAAEEKGKEKRITKRLINNLTRGRV